MNKEIWNEESEIEDAEDQSSKYLQDACGLEQVAHSTTIHQFNKIQSLFVSVIEYFSNFYISQ